MPVGKESIRRAASAGAQKTEEKAAAAPKNVKTEEVKDPRKPIGIAEELPVYLL